MGFAREASIEPQSWQELNCFKNTEAATIYAFFNLGTALSSSFGAKKNQATFRFPGRVEFLEAPGNNSYLSKNKNELFVPLES